MHCLSCEDSVQKIFLLNWVLYYLMVWLTRKCNGLTRSDRRVGKEMRPTPPFIDHPPPFPLKLELYLWHTALGLVGIIWSAIIHPTTTTAFFLISRIFSCLKINCLGTEDFAWQLSAGDSSRSQVGVFGAQPAEGRPGPSGDDDDEDNYDIKVVHLTRR